MPRMGQTVGYVTGFRTQNLRENNMNTDIKKYNCVDCGKPSWVEADGKYLCRECYRKLCLQRAEQIERMRIPDDIIENGVDDYPPLDGMIPRT